MEEYFSDISSENRYEMDEDHYKLLDYEWDYTLHLSQEESIDSIDAEYWPDIEMIQHPYMYTSTPKLEKITKVDLNKLKLA